MGGNAVVLQFRECKEVLSFFPGDSKWKQRFDTGRIHEGHVPTKHISNTGDQTDGLDASTVALSDRRPSSVLAEAGDRCLLVSSFSENVLMRFSGSFAPADCPWGQIDLS